jgi:hypothetical protein
VSGDFAGIAREVKGEIVSFVCRAVEEEIKTTLHWKRYRDHMHNILEGTDSRVITQS